MICSYLAFKSFMGIFEKRIKKVNDNLLYQIAALVFIILAI